MRARTRQAGFSLVLLIMTITVIEIMLAAALPRWSEMIRRDKEEELISRGFQYAEAIRLFQRRFQRYPVSLDELIKVKPRCLRQAWKDPMTENGRWVVIFLNQGSPLAPAPGLNGTTPPTGTGQQPPQQGNGLQPPGGGNGLDPNGPELAVGPIVGVHSRSTQKSLLMFYGYDHYNQWEFRVDLLTRRSNLAPGAAVGGGAGGAVLSTRWLGRPIESFVPTGNGLPPNALGPNALTGGSPFGASGASGASGPSGVSGPPVPPPTGMPPG
jgi:type II secretory pathway pseudopilin PulG